MRDEISAVPLSARASSIHPPSNVRKTQASDYTPPTFELIPLDCEITAYAPDGDDPLF